MISSIKIFVLSIIFFANHIERSAAFDVVETAIFPGAAFPRYPPGTTVKLSCKADGYFEYCDWYHGSQVCKFEWKRWHSAVRKQSCSKQLRNRMNYVGHYDEHECKVELKNIDVSDSGNWTCKVEGYGFFTRGDIVKNYIHLEVENITRGNNSPTSSTHKSTAIPTISIRNSTLLPHTTKVSETSSKKTNNSSTGMIDYSTTRAKPLGPIETCQNLCPWSTKCNECSNCKWCSYCSSCSWPSEHCKYCNVCKDGPRDCVTCCGYE